MSSVVSKTYQVGSDSTATNNFTIRQPATPDGTVRIANGNSGTTTDLVTVTSAGNVGVGTTSPGAKLDVSGDIIGRATTLRFKDSGNTTQYGAIYADSTTFNVNAGVNNLLLYSAGTERMRLDSSGNLGLGVTPSAWNSAYKALQLNTQPAVWGSSDALFLTVNQFQNTSGSNRYIANGFATQYRQDGGQHQFYTAPSGTAGNAISFTQAMTLTAGGDLGVGTSSPAKRFHVFSSTSAEVAMLESTVLSSDNVQLRFKGFSGERWAIGNNVATGGTGVNFDFYDLAASANRVRITGGGDLLVNRTSTLGSAKFVVEADTTTANPMTVSNSRSTAATDYSILFYRNASLVGSVQTSLTATSYVTSSDYRLKENIQPMTGALAKVAALKPVTYKWKATGGEADGFIAHELAEVCPQAVTGEKDAVDADGNLKYQGIDTSFLVATLTAAIQELKAELDSVKTELALLKGTA